MLAEMKQKVEKGSGGFYICFDLGFFEEGEGLPALHERNHLEGRISSNNRQETSTSITKFYYILCITNTFFTVSQILIWKVKVILVQ